MSSCAWDRPGLCLVPAALLIDPFHSQEYPGLGDESHGHLNCM